MAQLLRVQNFNVSSDGIGAGEDQTLERPFGHVDPERLFAWAGATASWPMRTDPDQYWSDHKRKPYDERLSPGRWNFLRRLQFYRDGRSADRGVNDLQPV